jgi:hypothetical protein
MRIPILSLLLTLGVFFGSTAHAVPPAVDRHLEVTCRDPRTVKNDQRYKEVVGNLEAIGAKGIQCFSCYRDPEYQRQLCNRICGADSCPGRCARPGFSQHQKQNLVTCDLNGIPKGAPGCEMLKKLCDEKYGGLCGIGGYPGGSFHFGVHDDHFSAWNQCGYLKGNVTKRATDMRERWQSIVRRIRFLLGGGSGG